MYKMFINMSNLVEFIEFGDDLDDVNLYIDGFCNRKVEVVFWVLYFVVGIIIFIGNSFMCIVLLVLKWL